MKRNSNYFTMRFFIVLNILFMLIPYAYMWIYHYLPYMYGAPFYRKGTWVIFALFTVVYYTYTRIYEGYLVSLNKISELFYSQVLAVAITDFILYIVTWLLFRFLPSVLPIGLAFVIQIILSIIWCHIVHHWYFKTNPPYKTAVIYSRHRSMESLIKEYGMEKKFEIHCNMLDEECISQNMEPLKDVEAVLLCGVQSHQRNIILKYCIEHDITMYLIPRVGDVLMSGATQIHMFHLPILRSRRYNPSTEYLVIKRLMDIVLPLIVLIITSPFFLITAIAIKINDGGPVFYKQVRLTKDGKMFKVIKFRSMKIDAEKDGVARLSTGDNDDRITSVGKIIRKVRIDELPQLINIIKGDMSIVGPRPERPEIATEYEKELPEFRLRLQAKAGLTGYAQVYGKYNTIPYDKLLMDLIYISKPSVLEDLRIIFATIKILFIPDSTEGIDKDKTTAM